MLVRFTTQMNRNPLPIAAYDVGHVELARGKVYDQNNWPFFQLICCYQGQGKVHIADHGEFDLSPGTILFFTPNTRHHYYAEHQACSLSWVSFQGYLVEKICEDYQLSEAFGIMLDRNYRKFKQDIQLIFDQVDEPFPMEKISTILYGMVIEYFRKLNMKDVQSILSDGKQDLIVKTAVEWINQNIHEPTDIALLASTLQISRQHLSRLFRQTFGISTKSYWTNLKILHAQRELINRAHLPVKEIAGKLGFVNVSHFNRVFREETGVTPLQFRLSYWLYGDMRE